jgi:hypothetical protein
VSVCIADQCLSSADGSATSFGWVDNMFVVFLEETMNSQTVANLLDGFVAAMSPKSVAACN